MAIYPATKAFLEEAAQKLQDGALVAFPTETVYGLGADARSDHAVAKIFAAKGRPRFNPLISHIASVEAAEDLVEMDERAHLLAEKFWPGPLTLVLPRRKNTALSLLTTSGLDSAAIRIPSHPVALALLRLAAIPIAAPSANPSMRVSPTLAAHVDSGLGDRVDMILDGGPCDVGVESTVVSLLEDQAAILRPGGLSKEELESVIGPLRLAFKADAEGPRSPGQSFLHYAPSLPVRMNAETPLQGEVFLGFGAKDGFLNLSPSGDVTEAAAHLFAMLRALDRPDFSGIAVAPIPSYGLGLAINDRLERAACSRGGHDVRL